PGTGGGAGWGRSPDRAPWADRRSPPRRGRGDLRSQPGARSGDRAPTRKTRPSSPLPEAERGPGGGVRTQGPEEDAMRERRRLCFGVVWLAGLAAAPLVSTGQVGAPAEGKGPPRDEPPAPAVTKGEPHPLDPLAPDEMATAARVLRDERRM